MYNIYLYHIYNIYHLSLYILTIEKTDILCVCKCIPDSLKMGTVGGSWSLPYIIFKGLHVWFSLTIYGLCLVFDFYLKFAHLVGKELICIYILK